VSNETSAADDAFDASNAMIDTLAKMPFPIMTPRTSVRLQNLPRAVSRLPALLSRK
jgi:hypothetical protein